MSMTLKPGTRLFGATCATELIVVAAPADDVDVTIGGVPALTDAAGRDTDGAVQAGHDGGAAMGKRYVDDAATVELLCTKAGDGVPAINDELLELKEAKPLPASD